MFQDPGKGDVNGSTRTEQNSFPVRASLSEKCDSIKIRDQSGAVTDTRAACPDVYSLHVTWLDL